MLRKLNIIFTIAIISTFALAACSGGDSSEKTPAPSPLAPHEPLGEEIYSIDSYLPLNVGGSTVTGYWLAVSDETFELYDPNLERYETSHTTLRSIVRIEKRPGGKLNINFCGVETELKEEGDIWTLETDDFHSYEGWQVNELENGRMSITANSFFFFLGTGWDRKEEMEWVKIADLSKPPLLGSVSLMQTTDDGTVFDKSTAEITCFRQYESEETKNGSDPTFLTILRLNSEFTDPYASVSLDLSKPTPSLSMSFDDFKSSTTGDLEGNFTVSELVFDYAGSSDDDKVIVNVNIAL